MTAAMYSRVEISMENSGFRIRGQNWGMMNVVFKITANEGNQIAGNGQAVEDGGDERGGAAEGFADDGAVLDQDVVAVITHN